LFCVVPQTLSKELRTLIESILQPDEARRPTMEQVLSTPILRTRAEKFRRWGARPVPQASPHWEGEAQIAPKEAQQRPPNRPVSPAVAVHRIDLANVNGERQAANVPSASYLSSIAGVLKCQQLQLWCLNLHLRIETSDVLSADTARGAVRLQLQRVPQYFDAM
jgi:hypothetical protein